MSLNPRRRSSTDRSTLPATIHLVEPGGRGGVYQHTVGVAEALAASGVDVVLHTAADPEVLPSANVSYCPCVRWQRSGPRALRQAVTAARYLGRVLPHLRSELRHGSLLHVQGLFGIWMTEITVRGLRGSPVVFTPHNLFARTGGPRAFRSIARSITAADVSVAFSVADAEEIARVGGRGVIAPFVFSHPEPDESASNRWRSTFGDGPHVGLLGQIRSDKRPDVFVEACALAGIRPIIVGEDLGGLAVAHAAAERLGTDITVVEGFLALQDFVDVLSSLDVVVSPQVTASTSGPLALARDLGVATVANDVGGLGEVATVTASEQMPEALAAAIEAALATEVTPTPLEPSAVADAYQQIYAVAVQRFRLARGGGHLPPSPDATASPRLQSNQRSNREEPGAGPLRVTLLMNSSVDGGAEHWVRRLGTGLAGRGVETTLAGSVPRWGETGLRSVAADTSSKWSARSPLDALRHLPRDRTALIAGLADTLPADLVHMHFKREQLLATRTAARAAPVVWTEHGVFHRGRFSGPLREGYRRAASATSAIVCVSTDVAADVTKICGPGTARIEVIENAVDLEYFRPPTEGERQGARERFGLQPDDLVAVSVTRLHPGKRVDRALKAAAACGGRLLLVGDGPDARRLARQLPHGSVMPGFLADPRPALWAADFAIFVGALTEGGSPQALLEYAASGLATAAFEGDVGANLAVRLGGRALERPEDLDLRTAHGLVAVGATTRSLTLPWALDLWLDQWSALYSDVASQ
jgi:glycosyltransferase involved in cell wall biosynthesis